MDVPPMLHYPGSPPIDGPTLSTSPELTTLRLEWALDFGNLSHPLNNIANSHKATTTTNYELADPSTKLVVHNSNQPALLQVSTDRDA